jgi:multicomponent Na+:H+ antiporter subunit D
MNTLLILILCGAFSNCVTKANLRSIVTPLFALISFSYSCLLTYNIVFSNNMEGLLQITSIPLGFASLNFGINLINIAFVNLVLILWFIASIYSYSYIKTNYPTKKDTIFQLCYSFAVFFAVTFAFAKDVLTMFIIYELLTISTIPLVGFKQTNQTKQGLFKYLIVLFGCSLVFLLPATLFVISQTGIVIFDGNGFIGNYEIPNYILKILLFIFILGIGKAAFFPFHIWLPSAMVAPTPVSGLLHAVAVVKVGAFFVIKLVVDVFGLEFLKTLLADFNFLMYLSAFTILFASIVATFQGNLKKRLAYSTIAQISYIVLSLSTFTKIGVFAAMLQIVSHAIAKILLFFSVGGFYTATHSNQIIKFVGMYNKNKVASIAFIFASFSLCGMPFTIGFFNKGMLFYNLVDSNFYLGIVVLTISAFLSFWYLMPVCYALLKPYSQKTIQNYTKIPLTFNFVFYFLILLNIVLFFLVQLFFINYVNGW